MTGVEPESFEAIFAIEREADDTFTAELDGFGGFTVGCATLAAARTAPGLSLHSIHTSFLRPAPTERPVALQIRTISNGRRFARRCVEIREGEKLLFHLLASFAAPSEGPELTDGEPPDAPPPESLPTAREVAEREGWDHFEDRPIEMRWVGRPWSVDGPSDSSHTQVWVRPRVAPSDDSLRAAGICFLADFHSHWPVARKLGEHFEPESYTSLDQSVWIHRSDPWDDFWLLSSRTPGAHAGRSLGHRTLHTRDGRLVASMAQEAIIPGARPRES